MLAKSSYERATMRRRGGEILKSGTRTSCWMLDPDDTDNFEIPSHSETSGSVRTASPLVSMETSLPQLRSRGEPNLGWTPSKGGAYSLQDPPQCPSTRMNLNILQETGLELTGLLTRKGGNWGQMQEHTWGSGPRKMNAT